MAERPPGTSPRRRPQTWTAYEEAAEAQGEREQAAEDALRGRYAAAFEAYAERFAAAVLDEAQALDGLAVPVEVKAETDPDASWWDAQRDTINTQEWDEDDDLARRLWAAARQRVGLPVLDETPPEATWPVGR